MLRFIPALPLSNSTIFIFEPLVEGCSAHKTKQLLKASYDAIVWESTTMTILLSNTNFWELISTGFLLRGAKLL